MLGYRPQRSQGGAPALDPLVPANHFYRHLARTLDLTFVRDLVATCYASKGRPSIDPVIFFKLQLILFFEGIRSERQLMRTIADRVSLRWYLGYAFGEALPHHSSLTRIRQRYGLPIFRRFFDAIVEQCQQAGLVWGRELYIDATKVEANASLASTRPRFFVEAHLAHLFAQAADARPPTVDIESHALGHPAPDHVVPVATPVLPSAATARHNWYASGGRQNRAARSTDYQRRADVQASLTDPDATVMQQRNRASHFGYHTHYVVDGGKARIILTALVTPAEVMENQPMQDLVWHTCFRWQIWPHHVTGDTTYGTVDNVVALEDAGIRAYMPLVVPGYIKGLFSKTAFVYDAEQDIYRCPRGALLTRSHARNATQTIQYTAKPATCNACALKARCTTSDRGRMVVRQMNEAYLDRVRAYHATAAYRKAMRKRKVWVEPLFGEAKDWHGLRRFRVRRLPAVNSEALLVASGQNLKRLLSYHGWGRRPWPSGAAGLRLAQAPAVLQQVPPLVRRA